MRLLGTALESPAAGAVGWTLLHSLWEGAIVAAVLAAVLLAVRSPRARYTAACLALLAMLGGFGATLVRVWPEAVRYGQTVRTPAFPVLNLGADASVSGSPHSNLDTVVPWLAVCWIAGVWIFYLAQVAGWVSLRRLRLRGVCAPPARWLQVADRLGAQLCISRQVLLLESCLADFPMVLGHFRPLILVPVGMLSGLPASQVEAVLLHELAHIRRCDYLVNLLQRCVEGLLFYHPAAWWISRVIRAERENCCDDVVVSISGNPQEYAVALTALEQIRWTGHEVAVAATGGNIVKRIRRLLYPEGPAGSWAPLVAAALVVATATVALAAWQSDSPHPTIAIATVALPARQSESPKQSSTPKREPSNPAETPLYAKWLNEDVVYIITKEERTAYEKLTTDAEREKFVEQFWLRRDPTPDTPRNEFKEEHYRRIAYANTRFAGGKAGWKTDRGRIYIQSGPPDEIESHPSGTADNPPFEVWRYRYIEGMGRDVSFKFIDATRNGDYELRAFGQGKGVEYKR